MNFLRNWLLLLAVVGVALAAPVEDDERILNGRDATPLSHPYQVALMQVITLPNGHEAQGQFCGGVILNKFWALTAAHCFDNITDPGNGEYRVHAGTLYPYEDDENSQFKVIRRAYCHPDYNETTIANDICLVKLETPLWINSAVRPIDLPARDYEATGQGEILGWGAMDENHTDSSFILQTAKISVSTRFSCQQLYHFTLVNTDHICLGNREITSACAGDSGGPFVQKIAPGNRPIVVGVSSFGGPTCSDEQPVVYTRVASFVDWIKDKIKQK